MYCREGCGSFWLCARSYLLALHACNSGGVKLSLWILHAPEDMDMTGDKKCGRGLAAHMACLYLLGLVGGQLWPLPAYSQQRPPPLPVVVGTVVEQAVVTEIDVVGSVEPHLTTTLSTEIAGLTLRFDLREGDFVQQGKTVVAQLKATDLELALAEAKAELAKARETVRKLKHGLRPEEIEEKRAEVHERKTWVEKYAKDLERAKSLSNQEIAKHLGPRPGRECIPGR